jgi:hypothetical protein
MTRPTPPPLELLNPLCGLCGNSTEHVGEEFACSSCGITWPDRQIGSENGEWDEPDAERCPSVDGRYLPGGCWEKFAHSSDIRQCWFADGHSGEHIHIGTYGTLYCWRTDQAATPEQLQRVAEDSERPLPEPVYDLGIGPAISGISKTQATTTPITQRRAGAR